MVVVRFDKSACTFGSVILLPVNLYYGKLHYSFSPVKFRVKLPFLIDLLNAFSQRHVELLGVSVNMCLFMLNSV